MRMKALLIIVFLFAAGDAWAHGSVTDYATSTWTWTNDMGVILPLYGIGLLFLVGTLRIWKRAGHGRGIHRWQAASFWSGWTILALALLSPLHWLSERLFTAHMIEHELLMLIAAPLLVMARPIGAFLWAFPKILRQSIGRWAQNAPVSAFWRFLTHPVAATLLHGAAIWGWHIPAAFAAALIYEPLHWLQHLSFLGTALLFWHALLRGHPGADDGVGVFWLFFTAMHSSALGILLTLSRTPWIPVQTDVAGGFGLTPLQDQQLAGLVMWVPSGLIYTAIALVLAARWIRGSAKPSPFEAGANPELS
jgi:putative membrane protein